MRTLYPVALVAAAMLILAMPGCNDSPTAIRVTEEAAFVANSAQLRIPLCHRTSSGDLTQITIADAAYATHMDHGDRVVGENGQCPAAGTSRLTVTVDIENPLEPWNSYLSVILYVTGEPEAVLGECYTTETCTYDVPTGSLVLLLSHATHAYTWSEPSCTSTSSCQMNGDQWVVVTDAENPY